MSILVFEATAVECSCPESVNGVDLPYHGWHPVVVMAGEPIWEGNRMEQGGWQSKEDAEEVAEERLRSRLGLLLGDSLAVRGVDT